MEIKVKLMAGVKKHVGNGRNAGGDVCLAGGRPQVIVFLDSFKNHRWVFLFIIIKVYFGIAKLLIQSTNRTTLI